MLNRKIKDISKENKRRKMHASRRSHAEAKKQEALMLEAWGCIEKELMRNYPNGIYFNPSSYN